jgi:plasmid maintenance system killer protein
LDICFATRKLEKLCNSEKLATKTWGDQQAKVLRRRLDQLRACSNLEEQRNLPGRCHELVGDKKGLISIDLVHPMRLLFEVAHNPIPKKTDGGLDRHDVTYVRVMSIEDTHG